MNFKTKSLALLVCLCCADYTFSWSQKIHRAIFELAVEDLPDFIRKDLEARAYYFKDVHYENDAYMMAAIPDILRHGFNLHIFDDYHYSIILYKDLSDNTIQVSNRNHLYKIIEKLTQHLTNYSHKRSDFFDTFSLVFASHLIVELFQPMHTISEDGLRTHVNKRINLHEYWDDGCMHFKRLKIPTIIDQLRKVEETGVFKFNGNDIEIDLSNPFQNYHIKYMTRQLRDLYSSVDERYGGGQQMIYDLMTDTNFIHSTDYKQFCLEISMKNLLNASKALKLFLTDVYNNLETKLEHRDESYYNVKSQLIIKENTPNQISTSKTRVNRTLLVVIVFQSFLILFLLNKRIINK